MIIDAAYLAFLLAQPDALDDPGFGWLCEEWSYAASYDVVLDPEHPTEFDLAEAPEADAVREAA